jgi:hypothetical protein
MSNWRLRFLLSLAVLVQAGCVGPAPVKAPLRTAAIRPVKMAHAKTHHFHRPTKFACPVPKDATQKTAQKQSPVAIAVGPMQTPLFSATATTTATASPIVYQAPLAEKAAGVPAHLPVCQASFAAGCCSVDFCTPQAR